MKGNTLVQVLVFSALILKARQLGDNTASNMGIRSARILQTAPTSHRRSSEEPGTASSAPMLAPSCDPSTLLDSKDDDDDDAKHRHLKEPDLKKQRKKERKRIRKEDRLRAKKCKEEEESSGKKMDTRPPPKSEPNGFVKTMTRSPSSPPSTSPIDEGSSLDVAGSAGGVTFRYDEDGHLYRLGESPVDNSIAEAESSTSSIDDKLLNRLDELGDPNKNTKMGGVSLRYDEDGNIYDFDPAMYRGGYDGNHIKGGVVEKKVDGLEDIVTVTFEEEETIYHQYDTGHPQKNNAKARVLSPMALGVAVVAIGAAFISISRA